MIGRNSHKYLRKSNCGNEIELQVSTISKLEYYATPYNVKKIRTGDLWRMFNLSNVMDFFTDTIWASETYIGNTQFLTTW